MTARVVSDLSKLPAAGFRQRGLWFWAALGFMAIEGTGFALACAAYVYLMHGADQWPLADRPPDVFWGALQTFLMLVSLIPNALASHSARLRALIATRLWTVALTLLTALCLVVRIFEFAHLNTRWDQDGYGSIVFGLMVLHTTHVLTDFIGSVVLTVFLFTHPVHTERYSDVDDDSVYWGFVVVTWLPIYLLIYWAPRWVA